MISRRELRIGNFVYSHVNERQKEYMSDTFLYVVEEIKSLKAHVTIVEDWAKFFIKSTHLLYEKVNPVPLTEEWLLKFGFEKSDEDKSIIGQTIKIFSNEVSYDITVCEGHICFQFPSIWNGEIEIKYVHQLQNLFFALTGNELTVVNSQCLSR